VEFRVLHRSERESWLALLDGWDVGDGWRGRDFFRRYLEQDPTYADENVWVAAQGGRLASCVQIFPRELRIAGAPVPMGGIGSVFTEPEFRRRGLGQALLERASEDMRARGLEVSMLFPAPERQDWYRRLGWDTWERRRLWLSGGPASPRGRVELFEPERDLAGVRRIHAAYSGALDGTEARGDGLWQASLRNAGNPAETFLVARGADGAVAAYARATVLSGMTVLMELGRTAGAEAGLADVMVAAAGEKAVAPDLAHEPGLEDALRERGLDARELRDPLTMLRCLDAPVLARRLIGSGAAVREGEAPNELLRRVLPPERLHYWVADRF
jgi:GNAT superfamily N-acetyltransferase